MGVAKIKTFVEKNREMAGTGGNEDTVFRPLVICGPSGAGKGTLLE